MTEQDIELSLEVVEKQPDKFGILDRRKIINLSALADGILSQCSKQISRILPKNYVYISQK